MTINNSTLPRKILTLATKKEKKYLYLFNIIFIDVHKCCIYFCLKAGNCFVIYCEKQENVLVR